MKYKCDEKVLFGVIKEFLLVTTCHCNDICEHSGMYYALIQQFSCSYPYKVGGFDVPIDFILSFSLTDKVDIVPIDCVQCVCFKMCLEEAMFLSVPLNVYELE